MAGTYDKLVILNEWMNRTYRWMDVSFVRRVNEQTGSTINFSTRPTDGDYFQTTSVANEANKAMLAKPNVQSSVTNEEFTQLVRTDIKVGMVMTPYEWQTIALRWSGLGPQALGMIWAATTAESFFRRRLETLVTALVASFAKGLGAAKDATVEKVIDDQSGGSTADATKKIDVDTVTQTPGKLGDMYEDISAIIMHSGAFFGMQSQNLVSYQRLFMYPRTFVQTTPLGTPIYVTDLPILKYTHGSATKYRTLFLKPQACELYDNGDFEQLVDRGNGQTWINTTAQAQTTFNIGVRGFTWADLTKTKPLLGTTAGTGALVGLHTDAGAIDAPASWAVIGDTLTPKKPISYRELPGVMLISQ